MKYTPAIVNRRSDTQGGPPPRGLGDVIHKAAQVTGLARLAPKGCGCQRRRRWLNNLGKNSRLTGDPADTKAQP